MQLKPLGNTSMGKNRFRYLYLEPIFHYQSKGNIDDKSGVLKASEKRLLF
jgi:hypothetical protein